MKLNNETRIGIMVTIVFVLLGVLTFRAGEFNVKRDGYLVNVHFSNIDGIKINAPVMFNGFEKGHVKGINVVESEEKVMMELVVWLSREAGLHQGSKAYVKNMGFLGEKYVGLTAGNVSAPLLEEGAIIYGADPADMDQLLLDGQAIAKEIKEVSANLNKRLKVNEEKINRVITNLDTSMEDVAFITNNVAERLRVNESKIDHMFSHLEASSVNLDQFSYDLKEHPWKLFYRDKEKRQKNIDLME